MKHLLKITITAICTFISLSCGDDSKKAQKELKQTIETVSNAPSKAKNIKTINEEIELLHTEAPLTEAQFKQWIPEVIDSYKRTDLMTNLMGNINIGSCAASYRDSETKQLITFKVFDGAGEMGVSAISPFVNSETASVNNETASGYQKSVEKNGIKAIENYLNGSNQYEIIFLYGKRFGVSVETEGISNVDDVWRIIEKLNLNELSKMAN